MPQFKTNYNPAYTTWDLFLLDIVLGFAHAVALVYVNSFLKLKTSPFIDSNYTFLINSISRKNAQSACQSAHISSKEMLSLTMTVRLSNSTPRSLSSRRSSRVEYCPSSGLEDPGLVLSRMSFFSILLSFSD